MPRVRLGRCLRYFLACAGDESCLKGGKGGKQDTEWGTAMCTRARIGCWRAKRVHSNCQYLLVTAGTEDMIRTSSGARWKGVLARSWQCLVALVWWSLVFEAVVLGRFHCHAWPTRACRAVREMSCVKACVLLCALTIRSAPTSLCTLP